MHLGHGDAIGSYQIDQPISQGGMSHIYLASHCERPYYKVVLKFNASEKTTFQDLLRREADHLVALRHPSIVRIYPLRLTNSKRIVYQARAKDQPNRPWYFAMEYIAGGSLEKHLPQIMRLPISWRIELFYQVLLAVQFMHDHGYAHCDLKPGNILLRERPRLDRTPHPILIDLGSISNVNKRDNLTHTPAYSPPELHLAAGEPQNSTLQAPELLPPGKGDIWALGAILYELLAGAPLVKEDEPVAVAAAILKGEWPSIRSQQPDVHESLEILVSIMLQRNPHRRPEIVELIEAIEEKIASVAPPRIPIDAHELQQTGGPAI